MQCPRGEEQTLGQFALVSYIPDPLARFLDDLSRELTPGCNPRAHVTVLPPRPHHNDLKRTIERITGESRGFAPFWIETGTIEIFETSNVVYLSMKHGMKELRAIYRTLNCGSLEFRESFPYHPHITVAQDLEPEEAAQMAGVARKRWSRYQGPRGFPVLALSFVQNVAPSVWTDVATFPLGQEIPVGG
jgi:2'-5' RNA ligase